MSSELSPTQFKKVQDVFKFLKLLDLPDKYEDVVISMEQQFEESKSLSPKQIDYLFDIYERV